MGQELTNNSFVYNFVYGYSFMNYLAKIGSPLASKLKRYDGTTGEDAFVFTGALLEAFQLGQIYEKWRQEERNLTFEICLENEEAVTSFINSLPGRKKEAVKKIKGTIVSFDINICSAFDMGISYKDWRNNEGALNTNVPRETITPEKKRRVLDICLAITKIVEVEPKQLLELYELLLTKNL